MNVQKCRARIACGFVVAGLSCSWAGSRGTGRETAQCLPSAVVNKLTSVAEKSTSLLLRTYTYIHTYTREPYVQLHIYVLAYLLSKLLARIFIARLLAACVRAPAKNKHKQCQAAITINY